MGMLNLDDVIKDVWDRVKPLLKVETIKAMGDKEISTAKGIQSVGLRCLDKEVGIAQLAKVLDHVSDTYGIGPCLVRAQCVDKRALGYLFVSYVRCDADLMKLQYQWAYDEGGEPVEFPLGGCPHVCEQCEVRRTHELKDWPPD